ncbi:MAG: class I SAM-dependent methyltransferase [Promethearchaeota archaeon]|nr:MAG: class I SAM-dependent methyltransferase [Candidatus Lokiarchaeota archaeon]
MKFNDIVMILKDIPHIGIENGKILYDFIRVKKFNHILELGFAHGTSTCYMAAALKENGLGVITTIDRDSAKERKPNIFNLSEKLNFEEIITPIFAEKSYNWELMKIVEKNTIQGKCTPVFDFCYIDGAHTWEVDGLAFFLVEKLLKPGAWILFDDIEWTFEQSPALKDSKIVKKMPEEERKTPQVKKIFNLLVSQHPNFENLKISKGWGWAQKRTDHETYIAPSKIIENIYANQIIKVDIVRYLKKFRERVLRKTRR